MERKWYAVYTQPHSEKKVADLLMKKKIETYCPLNRISRQSIDRKKIVSEPMFPSYVFVHISETAFTYVKHTDGVLHFVYWRDQPAIITNEEIDAIQTLLSSYTNVVLQKRKVNAAEKVKIFHAVSPKQSELREARRNSIRISLPSLGYVMVAEVTTELPEPLYRDDVHAIIRGPGAMLT